MANFESNENTKFVLFGEVFKKLGQTQYISRFINPDEKLHDDGTPLFSNIRVEGNPDDYHNLRIHPDDIKSFVEQWLAYKKSTSPFFGNKEVEDFI